jgi:hypothetical protein
MPYARVLTSTVAGTATAIGVGWLLLTSGAKTDSAKAIDVTTDQAAAKAGAQVIPSDPPLTVEPAGYR